jgi:hypothetical protein
MTEQMQLRTLTTLTEDHLSRLRVLVACRGEPVIIDGEDVGAINVALARIAHLEALVSEVAALARRPHDFCEDSWYTCPKHPEGCANDDAGDECNCGADEHNARVDHIIKRSQ